MAQEPFNVLFLCTGNSARSIMARNPKCLGKGKVPSVQRREPSTGKVNPLALELLDRNRIPVHELRSKTGVSFRGQVRRSCTLCLPMRSGAAEPCPVWPGQPMTAHWGVHDPASIQGTDEEKRSAFLKAYTELYRRISLFTCLSIETLDKLALKEKLDEIGRYVMTLGRAAAAEAIGTGLLLAIVVGSGIMGERLAQGNVAVTLLANSIATGAVVSIR